MIDRMYSVGKWASALKSRFKRGWQALTTRRPPQARRSWSMVWFRFSHVDAENPDPQQSGVLDHRRCARKQSWPPPQAADNPSHNSPTQTCFAACSILGWSLHVPSNTLGLPRDQQSTTMPPTTDSGHPRSAPLSPPPRCFRQSDTTRMAFLNQSHCPNLESVPR